MSDNSDVTKLLQQIGAKPSYFSLSSRYRNIPTRSIKGADGQSIVFVQRRFIPRPENFSLLQEHIVTEGERLDNIANQYLGDPERFWQICDANNVVHPDELTEKPGNKIRITLPEGIPGSNNA